MKSTSAISKNKAPIGDIHCRICRGKELYLVGNISVPEDRAGELWNCRDCGSQSFFPADSAEPYGKSYYGEGVQKITGLAGWIRRNSAHGRAVQAGKLIRIPGKVLDIGCGDGTYLSGMAANGWEVFGTELDTPALARAESVLGQGRVATCVEELPANAAGNFNLITLWQVFEHLPDPSQILDSLPKLLAPGGFFAIGVPDPLSWQSRIGGMDWLHLDPPRHLHLSPQSTLVEQAGRRGLRLVGATHPWLEYGVIGVAQTIFNKMGFRRDEFFELLKSGSPSHNGRALAWWLGLAAVLPVSLLWAASESALGRSATMELWFQVD